MIGWRGVADGAHLWTRVPGSHAALALADPAQPASYVSPAKAERRENAGISQDPLAYSNYASRIEPPGQRHERHALLSVILSRGRNRLELRQIVGYLEPRRFARNEYVSQRSHARIVVKRCQRNAIFCNRRWPIRR